MGSSVITVMKLLLTRPKDVLRSLVRLSNTIQATDLELVNRSSYAYSSNSTSSNLNVNPLYQWFELHTEGRGIWKWQHYFDIYQTYLSKYVGNKVKILEIGSYSGGSLELWREYLGKESTIFGLDIEKDCEAYNNSFTKVFIGDQSDRIFLRSVMKDIGSLDILIDDGSHLPEHQIATFEESFSYIAPGGVYICEDVQGIHNAFLDYVHGLIKGLCSMNIDGTKGSIPATSIQQNYITSLQDFALYIVL